MLLTPLNELSTAIHANAVAKGWWEDDRPFTEIIALIHSEVSEALEEYRNGHGPNEVYYKHGHERRSVFQDEEGNLGKPEGVPIELADVIIRILDYAGYTGMDIDSAVERKIAYNATRPHRHGGKRA